MTTKSDLPEAIEIPERTLGRLKVFLGYASGVEESIRMLDEGSRRRERGQDVVVGALRPRLAPGVEAHLGSLEIVPTIDIEGFPVMNVPGILKRSPQVCLVEGLAFDNPIGSRNAYRWQDIEEILSAGIAVVASVSLHSIDDQQDAVNKITGMRVKQTVPRHFIDMADEIVIVDVSSETASERDVALRGMALLLSADVIEAGLQRYLKLHGLEPFRGTQERFLVCLTPGANAQRMVASALRNAARFHCDVAVIYVKHHQLSDDDARRLEDGLSYARSAGAITEALVGEDFTEEVVRYARARGVTQIFIGHSTKTGWSTRLFGSSVNRLVRAARGMDVRIFPH